MIELPEWLFKDQLKLKKIIISEKIEGQSD